MRVHLVGNVCNNHYALAKHLRSAGVDAHLFFSPENEAQQQPQSEDPELADNLPEWCHPFRGAEVGDFLSPDRAFLDRISACDVIHVHDLHLIWAAMTGRPYVWHPFGWDFYRTPFFDERWSYGLDDPTRLLLPALMRKAIADAAAIVSVWWFDCWSPGYLLLRRLGVEHRTVCIPMAIDATRFSPGPKKSFDELLGVDGPRESAVRPLCLFHPTRQMLSPNTPVYFGNDILYRALGRAERENVPFRLVVVEKGNSDEALAKKLIADARISHRVAWVPAMPRHRLVEWYRAADITVAELAGGSFGSVGTEALACGSALLGSFLTSSSDPTFFPPPIQPPMIKASTEDDIVEALVQFSTRRDELQNLGTAGRRWIEDHMAGDVVARDFVALYERVLVEHGVSSARPSIRFGPDGSDHFVNGLRSYFAPNQPTVRSESDYERMIVDLASQLILTRQRRDADLRSLRFLINRLLREIRARVGRSRPATPHSPLKA